MLRTIGTCAINRVFSVQVRHHKPFRYPKVTYLPFEWDYPEKKNFILESGDLNSDFGFSEAFLNSPRPPFDKIPEFETAPEPIKRIFSQRFVSRTERRQALQEAFVSRVRRHPLDKESIEYKIAERTFYIRFMREHYLGNKIRNRPFKVAIMEAVETRRSLLTKLKRLDSERYEFVKTVLGIEHTPPPLERLPEMPTRKGVLRQMTAEYAEKMKQEKMDAYHEKLKVLQKEFEVEKRQAEEWIAKEIEELKLTEEEVDSLEFKARVFQ